MARNSADVFDHERANISEDDREVAEALAAIDESWQDESERTDVIRPSHLMPRVLAPIEPELERLATSSHPQPPLRAAEDPGWDEDREQTFAVDFDRLAPWHVPELTPPAFEEEKTAYFERTADFELLDARFVAEYTDRLQAAKLPLVQVVPPNAQSRVASEREWQADLRSREVNAAESDDLGFAATAWHADFHDAQQEWAASNYVPSEEETTAGSPSARAARLNRGAANGKNAKRANGSTPVARGRSSAPARQSAAPVRRGAAPRASVARAPAPAAAATTASLRPARPSQVPPRLSKAPARPSQAPARVSQPPARPSQAPARLSQAPVRPSQGPAAAFVSKHPATLPFAAAYDSDLAELRPNRARASTWIWYSASAIAGVALVLAVRAWSGGGFELTQTSQPTAASETTVSAAQQQAETGFAITSQPEGAQIYVDGRPTGFITPGRVRRLTPGLHSVELKLNGFYDTSLPAVLRDGSMLELEAVQMRDHTPEPPALASNTGGQAPLVAALPPRVSRRSARHGESRRARRHSISRNAPMPTLDAGEPAQVVEVAAPGEGVLRINSRPWSRVFIDDKFVGNTPQRALHVAAGQHEVRLVNEQMSMSKKFRVVVREGETLTRVEMLTDDAEEQRSNVGKSGPNALAHLDSRKR